MNSTVDNADGYLTEIPYLLHYHRELNPAIQSFALCCREIAALTPSSPFKFIELGCGFGLPTLMHAAANPQATFVGVDFIPAHIATARHIAEAAKLPNVQFIEAAFANLPAHNLPMFDAISLHGVWSWINDENRSHLLKFIDRHLAPSGVLYLSYNALPGLAAALPVRELMMRGFLRTPGDTSTRVQAGVALAEKIRGTGAQFFSVNPFAAHVLDDLKKRDINGIAHEYFNADWWPFYFGQVADALKPSGLSYGASAKLLDNFDGMNFPDAALAQLASVTDPIDLETLKDFYANREFRRDLFVRTPAPRVDCSQALLAMPFITATGPQGIDQIVKQTARGNIRPHRERTLAMLEAMQGGPSSVTTLSQSPLNKVMSQKDILENLLILTALGAAEPALPTETLQSRKAGTARLNAVLWETAIASEAIRANVSPVTGGGVTTERVEQLFLLALHRNEDPVKFLQKSFNIEGDLAGDFAVFEQTRLPLLKKFGIA